MYKRQFYNNRLGRPYAAAGTKLDMMVIKRLECSGSSMVAGSVEPTVMGVDVGGSEGDCLHVNIRALKGDLLWAGTKSWVELDDAMQAYNVFGCGIDKLPEAYMAKKLAQRHPDRGVILISYHTSPLTVGETRKENEGVEYRAVPRTASLDATLALIHKAELIVPASLPTDYWEHFTCLQRKIVDNGKTRYATYDEGGKADHYAHSLNLSEIVRDKSSSFEERFQIW